jgi:hypothetical protein
VCELLDKPPGGEMQADSDLVSLAGEPIDEAIALR